MLGETYCLAFCWYSRAFLVSAEALVVYSTALSTWASILMESCLKLLWPQKEFRKLVWPQKVVCDIKRVFTCSPYLPGFRPRQRCPWTSRATPWSTTPASQTSRALKSAMINFCQKKQASILIISFLGCKNWSLNADFLVWLEENEVYPEQKKRTLSQIKRNALLRTCTSVRSRWWLLATVPRCLRFVCDRLVGPLHLPRVEKDLKLPTHYCKTKSELKIKW